MGERRMRRTPYAAYSPEEHERIESSPGLCECGCGQKTNPATATDRRRKTIRGEPQRFIAGHHDRRSPEKRANGRVASSRHADGYVLALAPDHPRANKDGYVLEHILVVETALGHTLRRSAAVHHVNGDKANNSPTNLVACQDAAYHVVLHRRQRAYEACGNPNALRCEWCKSYDRQDELYVRPLNATNVGPRAIHRDCRREKYHALKRAKAVNA